MRFFGTLLLSLPLVAMASPLGSGVDSRNGKIDPFHGDWKCLRCSVWNEKGVQSDQSERGMVVRFKRDRIIAFDEKNAPIAEYPFRVLNPKGDAEGKIDFLEKGKPAMRLRYRFSDGRFFLCVKGDDGLVCPDCCGPGKKHRLYEFTPYQPQRLVQSHPLPPAPAEPR